MTQLLSDSCLNTPFWNNVILYQPLILPIMCYTEQTSQIFKQYPEYGSVCSQSQHIIYPKNHSIQTLAAALAACAAGSTRSDSKEQMNEAKAPKGIYEGCEQL